MLVQKKKSKREEFGETQLLAGARFHFKIDRSKCIEERCLVMSVDVSIAQKMKGKKQQKERVLIIIFFNDDLQ